MVSIELVLLQSPKIILDSSPCQLPYQKAEALLYFLAVEKRATRDQAAALLWDGCDEASARKNLRHAIYTVKKSLGVECICSSGRQELILNPELPIGVDYDRLMTGEEPEAYQGEFLKGFYIKGAPPFEEWMLTKRAMTLNCFLKLLRRRLSALPASHTDEAERLFALYLEKDPLDESVYRLMMERYEAAGLYYKAVRLYRRLERLTQRELSAFPGKELQQYCAQLTDAMSEDIPAVLQAAENLPGREEELGFLSDALKRFLGGVPTSLLLCGREGSGKTHLAEHFVRALSKRSFLVLQASCLETEASVLLQPLGAMVLQLRARSGAYRLNIDSALLEGVSRLFPLAGSVDAYAVTLLDQLFFSVGEQVPLVLFFDNMHFMDPASLDFISRLIRARNPNILVLGTVLTGDGPGGDSDGLPGHIPDGLTISGPQGDSGLHACLEPLVKKNLLLCLRLSPLAQDGSGPIGKTTGSQDIPRPLADRLRGLSPLEDSVLELLSACQSHATLGLFEDLLHKSSLELLDALEHLKELELIGETSEQQNAGFVFCSNSLRKKIYERMSLSKRCYFHRTLAEHLKHLEEFGASDYECLIYHYCHAGCRALELKYRILALEEYTYRNYELYPLQYAPRRQSFGNVPSFTGYCDLLEDRLLSLTAAETASIQCPRLYALLLRTKAQYCIAQGGYREGLKSLRKALQINRQSDNDPLMRIRCLRLINFYRLNIWHIRDLDASLSECLRLGKEGGYEEDYAIDCRLYGLYMAMEGNYAASLRYLKRALRIFSLNPLKSRAYTLNIAGCYNYMGETYRKQKQFSRAIQFYRKAVQTCEAGHNSGNAVFYSNLGRAYLALGDRLQSASSFYLSNKLYDESSALIGRSITKGYVSILEAEKGEFDSARELLNEAKESAHHLASPNSLGLLALASRELTLRWPEEFAVLLPDSANHYQKEAVALLKHIPGAYEVEELI